MSDDGSREMKHVALCGVTLNSRIHLWTIIQQDSMHGKTY